MQSHPVRPDEAFHKRVTSQPIDPSDLLSDSFVVNAGVSDLLRRHGYDHYVTRLKLRKLLGVVVAREMETTLGRKVDERELGDELVRRFDARNAQIALKGWKDFGKPNYTADEELVVTAFLTAVLTGCETMILTRDTDIQDQFVRLVYMMLGDYHAHLFGEVAADPANAVPLKRMPLPPNAANSLFNDDHIMHFVMPERDVHKLPPPACRPVHVHCYVLGNHQPDLKITLTGSPPKGRCAKCLS